MERDSLPSGTAREYIQRSGGTAVVAASLGVPHDEVVIWARDGVESVDQSIALVNLAHFGPRKRGPRGRYALATLDELWEVVDRYAVRALAAGALGVSERALRRYLSGERIPPPAVAERILALLNEPVSPDATNPALPGYAEPNTATPPDQLP